MDKSKAYELFHEGVLALSDISNNGIRVDISYCKNQRKKTNKKIKELEMKLSETKTIKKWKKVYKDKFNIDSNPQLSEILFNHLGLAPPTLTAKGNASVDKNSLHLIKLPVIKLLIKLRQLKKINNTYLKNILEETYNGYLHPNFHLHTVKTYRSSSSNPNFQNMPIRDKEMGKIIRRAFIPRENYLIGGIDYGGIEVRIAACYHKDKMMLEYIRNPEKDMHRDMAMELYKLKQSQVTKDIRYCAKNSFVFPEFYGSWYDPCAYNLWGAIKKMGLCTIEGIPLLHHLKGVEIKTVKEFTNHVKKVEDRFWNKRFTGYRDWKKIWIDQYEKKGYFDMLTGFRCQGVLGKNDIINYPVQGVAFHCLLWSLIKLNKWLKKNKMRSKIVGQIHDDITMDVHKNEFKEVLEKAKKIMCKDISKKWEWLIVPLEIEAEFSEKNWYEKKEVVI